MKACEVHRSRLESERPGEDDRGIDAIGVMLVELLAVPIGALTRQGVHDWLNTVALCLLFTPAADRAAWLRAVASRLTSVWPTMAQSGTLARELEALLHRAPSDWKAWKQQHAPEVEKSA